MKFNGKLVLIGVGLGIGNFLFQGLTARDWGVAFDTTCFQGMALVVVYIIQRLRLFN